MSKTGPELIADRFLYSGESFWSSGLTTDPGDAGVLTLRAGDVRLGYGVVEAIRRFGGSLSG